MTNDCFVTSLFAVTLRNCSGVDCFVAPAMIECREMINQQQNVVAPRQKILEAARTGLFLAVLLAVQMLGLPNPVTGVLVNAVFIFVLLLSGLQHSLFLALLSPVGGIIFGHLPALVYPVMPVIICGNFVYISSYLVLKKIGAGRWLHILVPAALKGLIIGLIGYLVVKLFGGAKHVEWLLVPVLSIQFFTALGGLLVGERLYQTVTRSRGEVG